jgi:hypothetical protein
MASLVSAMKAGWSDARRLGGNPVFDALPISTSPRPWRRSLPLIALGMPSTKHLKAGGIAPHYPNRETRGGGTLSVVQPLILPLFGGSPG